MSPTKRTTRRRAAAATTTIPATTIKRAHHEAKKQKQTIDINHMFHHAKAQKQRKEREYRDVLAPQPAGVRQSPVGRFFKPFCTGRGEDTVAQQFDPDYSTNRHKLKEATTELPLQGIAEVTAEYLEAQNENLQRVQERHAKFIAARRKGLPSSEDSEADQDRPWIPKEADIQAIDAKIAGLGMTLEDEIIKVQWREPNGAVITKSERLGDVIKMLTERVERRNIQIQEFEKERRKVVRAIETLKADVQGESNETIKANEKFEAQMQNFQDELEQVEKWTKTELEKLKKEERAAARKLNDKIKDVWSSIG